MAKQKILIVDDDNNIAELISLYLVYYGIVGEVDEQIRVLNIFTKIFGWQRSRK